MNNYNHNTAGANEAVIDITSLCVKKKLKNILYNYRQLDTPSPGQAKSSSPRQANSFVAPNANGEDSDEGDDSTADPNGSLDLPEFQTDD